MSCSTCSREIVVDILSTVVMHPTPTDVLGHLLDHFEGCIILLMMMRWLSLKVAAICTRGVILYGPVVDIVVHIRWEIVWPAWAPCMVSEQSICKSVYAIWVPSLMFRPLDKRWIESNGWLSSIDLLLLWLKHLQIWAATRSQKLIRTLPLVMHSASSGLLDFDPCNNLLLWKCFLLHLKLNQAHFFRHVFVQLDLLL